MNQLLGEEAEVDSIFWEMDMFAEEDDDREFEDEENLEVIRG